MKEKHEKELDKQALDFEAELNQYQEELSQKELNFQQTHEELTKRHSEIRSELVKAQLSSEKDLENMEEEKIRTIEEIKEQTKRDMEMIKENQKRETVLLEQKIQEETRQVMEAQKFEFEQEKRKLLDEKQVLETTLINKINTITELNQQEKEEEHKKIPSLSSDTQMWLNWFFFNIDDPKLEQFVSESEEAQRLVYTLGTKVATRSTNEFQKDMDEIEKRNKLIANSIKPVLMQLGIKGGDLRSAKDVHKLVRAFPLLQKQLTDYQERVRELEMELRLAKRKGQVSKWHVEQKHFIRN